MRALTAQLARALAGLCPRSLLLVTGERSYRQPIVQDALRPILAELPHRRFAGFASNPRPQDVCAGVALLATLPEPAVLAIGGGSVIDMAKLVAYCGARGVDPAALAAHDRHDDGGAPVPPIVAVPTTAGTGSEATPFATLYLDGRKHSLDDPAVLPRAAVLEPALTHGLPPRATAESGMDALAQAIESYWNVRATDASRAPAREAIVLIAGHLEEAVLRPTPAARAAMLRGAHLAGRAIAATRTTAAHAISYPMTAHWGVAHGQAVAVTLPHFLVYNHGVGDDDVRDPRGAARARATVEEVAALLGHDSVPAARDALLALMRRIGLATTLAALGIDAAGRERIVREGFHPDRVGNNPRALGEPALRGLLAAIAG